MPVYKENIENEKKDESLPEIEKSNHKELEKQKNN